MGNENFALGLAKHRRDRIRFDVALISCPECSAQVSSAAPSCPTCGFPIAASVKEVLETGRGKFDRAARTAGVDLSEYEAPKRETPSDAEIAILLSQKKQTNHILHLLLSVVTGGLWLIVWFLVAMDNGSRNKRIDQKVRGEALAPAPRPSTPFAKVLAIIVMVFAVAAVLEKLFGR